MKVFSTAVFMTMMGLVHGLAAPSMTPKDVRKVLSNMNTENFSQTLTELEPFLTQEAGCSTYAKTMRRVQSRANALGVEVPAGWALEAKATEKRRMKQNEFIKAKEEERLAAEAEAAEAEAEETNEAEAAAEGEAETVEEPELVEA